MTPETQAGREEPVWEWFRCLKDGPFKVAGLAPKTPCWDCPTCWELGARDEDFNTLEARIRDLERVRVEEARAFVDMQRTSEKIWRKELAESEWRNAVLEAALKRIADMPSIYKEWSEARQTMVVGYDFWGDNPWQITQDALRTSGGKEASDG